MPMARLCVCEDAGSVANEPAAVSACLSCVTGYNTIKPLLELSAIVMDGVLLGNLLLHCPSRWYIGLGFDCICCSVVTQQ